MEKLTYFIKEGFKNLWANGVMTIASVSVLTVCLLLMGSSVLVSFNVRSLIDQVSDKNQILVCLKDSLDQKGIDSIGDTLKGMDNVQTVTFVSRQEAFENAKDSLGKQSQLINGMENAYPNAYRVEVDKMSVFGKTADAIRKVSGVESVSANSAVANKLSNLSNVINWVGGITFGILGIVALFLIINTVKMAVYVRRREINIMKFVGARDSFIRWPFVVEGGIIGIFSGLLGIALQTPLYANLIAKLFATLNVAPVYFSHQFLYMGAGFVTFGVLMGVLGSLFSLRKYLNV